MYDYTNKLRGQDNRNSVFQILSQSTFKDWEVAKTEYDATDIAFVKIDGNTFTNYGQYQFIWEKTFVKEPQRSGSGSLGNLNCISVVERACRTPPRSLSAKIPLSHQGQYYHI